MNQAFYIAVCDDEQADREQTVKMAEEICRMEKIQAEIYKAENLSLLC